MAKFPDPDLARISSAGAEPTPLSEGSLWWRVYFVGGRYPTVWNAFRRFGPVATARFDHHLEPPALQARGVLYAAESVGVCIAEVFQTTRRVAFDGNPHLVGFRLARDVVVLNLCGLWPTRAGASQAIASGPRPRSRRWARSIANTFDQVEGLLYRSSMHGGDHAIALWDCPDALADEPEIDLDLADPRLVGGLFRTSTDLGYSVAIDS